MVTSENTCTFEIMIQYQKRSIFNFPKQNNFYVDPILTLPGKPFIYLVLAYFRSCHNIHICMYNNLPYFEKKVLLAMNQKTVAFQTGL